MRMSYSSFEIIERAVEAKKRNPEWRWGQAVFNTAREYYIFPHAPHFVDPFNDDSKVSLFLQWLDNELELL
jgi:hypothetical protein